MYFLSFYRNKYNWPEEIDVAGDIVAGQGHKVSALLVQFFFVKKQHPINFTAIYMLFCKDKSTKVVIFL